jgi:hypothetical protein
MTIHLVKLCVGIDDVEELVAWQARRAKQRKAAGEKHACIHRTRMMPKRVDELLDGGSIYWVIKGVVRVRQQLRAVEAATMDDGTPCAELALAEKLVRTMPKPMRPFQGWRYLDPKEAPADLTEGGAEIARMPAAMVEELRSLGLL